MHRSEQVGPYSQSELHSLLAKDVISPITLVRHEGNGPWRALRDIPQEAAAGTHKRKQNWATVALSIAVFLGAIAFLKVPTNSESGNVFGIISRVKNKQELLDVIRESKQIQTTETARFDFSRRNDLVVESELHIFGPRTYRQLSWIEVEMMMQKVRDDATGGKRNPWSNSAGFMDPARILSTSPAGPATSAKVVAAEGQFVQEFWRSIASSAVVDRYELYLRRFPFGKFADMATARIKELRKVPKEASVNGEEGTVKKKKSSNSSKTTKPTSAKITAVETSTQKTRRRCQIGNPGRCITSPLKTSEKDCIVSANNTKPYKPCIIRKYQSKKKS